jgi:hypothetical protein
MIYAFLSDKELALLYEWEKNLPEAPTGAIGGRVTFMLTQTSIGMVIKAKDNITDLEIDLTDYQSW